jgi:dTDP-4-amino-4,6-dideoxygalactose transaminase
MSAKPSFTVPYVDLSLQHQALKDELLRAVSDVIDSGQFILGPQVEEFERRFAALCGVKHAVGLNSGTDALILVLRALGIGPGDEVITAPNSFVASASCVALVGATPVFVDVRDDYNLDPHLLEAAITPHTKAIIPVHLTGRPADMQPITEIAAAHSLYIIEDAAQAVLAEYRGQRVGSFGAAGCFSLHPLKNLNACGDAGLVTTDDGELADRIRLSRNLGLKTRNDCVEWSSNSRLDTIQAAMLLVKLGGLEEWTNCRRANAAFYQEALRDLDEVRLPFDQPHERAVYHTFIIQAERRDDLQRHLADNGIGSAVHYPIPIHRQSIGLTLGYPAGSFPVTERQTERILSLPIFPELMQEQLERVATSVRRFYRG